ncbi:hypothetical protein [Micromonospora inaquosa]|uniref:Uncharacterized protein n=1 Tax=Micromonospora inaquosa TaxID=2203716 RepID=A0A3N9WID5_9ACTN|nr:hypothetical protein [Micromonospora inaquosa]RQW93616.1 hypothetical protein DLJ59_35940 [Micromonospora inaquosa]
MAAVLHALGHCASAGALPTDTMAIHRHAHPARPTIERMEDQEGQLSLLNQRCVEQRHHHPPQG